MPDNWDWSDFLEDEDEPPQKPDKNDPKSLRQFAQRMAKENKELKDLLAKNATESRATTITNLISGKKLPAKVATLVPANVEVDKIDAWLEEYKDLWPTQPEGGQAGGEAGETEDEYAEERAANDRMSAATAATLPATKPNDLMAKVNDPTLTKDGLLKLIEQSGGGYGSG